MTVRQRLHEITELNITKRLTQMKAGQLDEYIQALNLFVDSFPAQEADLRIAIENADNIAISKCLAAIREMLVSIYADDMAAECLKQIAAIKNTKPEKLEVYLTHLLTSAATLSIDIQMAVFADQNCEEAPLSDNSTDGEQSEQSVTEQSVKSILAVDDRPFHLNTLKNCLQETPYKLTCVASGNAALSFLQNRSPDLFILDIEMPEMDGYELAEKIKASGRSAPIIFLTANSTKEYVMRAIKIGAADFIVKPISKKQVLERIERLI